jgi:glutathione S-transferase
MSTADDLALYQTAFCPYCERVRGALRQLDVEIELRDLGAKAAWRRELLEATGRATVPCLRIERDGGEVEWMHESEDIVAYLAQRFGA